MAFPASRADSAPIVLDHTGMAVVMVVNDDRDMLEMYEALIRQIGHEVVTETVVESGPEAVRAVRADALVVDLRRPDDQEYGLRLIEDVRADPDVSSIPIILCSGAVEQIGPLIPRLESLQVPVLPKPFHPDELEQVLANALAGQSVGQR
jgi:CheY-like chemotaxis protein